ncbi:MAG: MaoC family dehydratase [Polaromonas sp.]|nr:MaoC family dehydratase [Polaromonas sp.]
MHYSYYTASENLYQERFGLDFEHFAAGQHFVHRPGITLTQQDNVVEALDTMNAAMIHYDAAYSAHTSWSKPLMVSTLTLKRLIGMGWKTFNRRKRITRFSRIAMTAPMFGGDTLYAETEVLQATPISAQLGLLRLRVLGFNQNGTQVSNLECDMEVWRSGAGRGLGAAADADAGSVKPAAQPRFASHAANGDGAWVEQTGLFFEDLQPGETYIHNLRRSFTAEEAHRLSLHAMEWSPQHHDALLTGDNPAALPEAIVVGAVTALTTRTLGRVTANVAWTDVDLPRPVLAGDTVEARSTIVSARESASRPSEGIVTVHTVAHNQRGEEVLSCKRSLLVYRRSAPNPYSAAGY